MKTPTVLAALTTAAAARAAVGLDTLVADLKSANDTTRGGAIDRAPSLGAAAVPPLATLMGQATELEHFRAARRALLKLVRHVGRPDAAADARAVEAELLTFLAGTQPVKLRREVIWMLSEIGGDAAVQRLGRLLADAEVREDARCALERIPSAAALSALKNAWGTATGEFKLALAESLVKRGETVPGFQSQKLKPVKPTPPLGA